MNLLRLSRLRPHIETQPLPDGALVRRMRGHRIEETLRLGPNAWHVVVIHADGSVDDLGVSYNLLTNGGRDLLAAGLGATGFGVSGTIATGTSATSLTATGTPFVADAYKGWRIYCPITGITTAPVYGNIGSNSTTVFTIDQWWNAADGTAGTPAATNGYMVTAAFVPRFMGLTADTGAASAASTVLTSEITNNGLERAKATYAHTPAAATYTLTNTFSVSGGPQTIHRGGLFTAANTTAAGVLVFETVASVDAIVTTSDSLVATWTVTLSG